MILFLRNSEEEKEQSNRVLKSALSSMGRPAEIWMGNSNKKLIQLGTKY